MDVLNVQKIKKDFPIFKRKIRGRPIIYLNSAATSQKPKSVIDSIKEFYENYNSNIYRGADFMSVKATQEYSKVRKKVANLINSKTQEIIFTKSTTESINLVMRSLYQEFKEGDEIILSIMEHHSNLVPWQYLIRKGVKLRFIDINEEFQLNINDLKKLLNEKTRFVSLTHVSNVLGTINPIKEICRIIKNKNKNIKILIDAAQSASCLKIDVKEIGCDFLAFSAHKMLGPMGVGVLYGRSEELKKMEPFLYGGDMIKEVEFEKSSFAEIPRKFEAGTQNVAGVIGFGKAIDYIKKIGIENIEKHEKILKRYALEKLKKIKNIKIYSTEDLDHSTGIISFNIKNLHPHDVAEFLGSKGICVRAGHLCSMTTMKRLNTKSVVRISFYIYNTKEDIDVLCEELKKMISFFKIK